MSMTPKLGSILDCSKGVNKDLLPTELDLGVWSDANNFRFRDGFAVKFGGVVQAFTTPAETYYGIAPYSISTGVYLVGVGLSSAYADTGAAATTQTPYPTPAGNSASTLTNPPPGAAALAYTMVGTTLEMNVGAGALHALTSGDKVSLWEFTTGGSLIRDVSITVTSSAKFTIQTSAVTAGNGYCYYNISDSTSVLSAGLPASLNGTADTTFCLGTYQGVMLLNSSTDGMFYWAGNTAKRFRRFQNTTYLSDVARPFKSFIIQLATTENGTKYPWRVSWSDIANPGDIPTQFTAQATNKAGNVDLAETAGVVIDCLPLGDLNIVYKTDSRWAMQFLETNEAVFAFRKLGGTDGLWAANCVVDTPKGHIFITSDLDIKTHQLAECTSIAEGRVRNWFTSNIDPTYGKRAFLTANKNKSEVWVCFPMTGSQVPNKALVWNWDNDTWALRDLPSVTCGTWGILPSSVSATPGMLVSTTAPKAGLVDSGTTDFGSTITATLERTGLHFGDRESIKVLNASRPHVDATAGNTASVYHGSAMVEPTAATYGSAITHTAGTTNKCLAFVDGGRYMAWKLSTTASDYKMRSIDIEFTNGGNY